MIQIMNPLKRDQLSEDEALDVEEKTDAEVIVVVQMADQDRKMIILRSLKLKMIRTSIVLNVQR